ncbi:MAG TPA: hypothetical protein VHX87_11980 [Galbitalea sp.]|jgi:transcriptional regulator with XRE-family HTH domain|nr:hypothetical protein [Galbitalea sp.]
MSSPLESTHASTIRRARARGGVGLRELARRLGVTPKAVSDWEKSEELGTVQVNTINRALNALGEDVVIGSRRRIAENSQSQLDRREERVTRELHRAVALKLVEDPEAVLRVVPSNIDRLRQQVRGADASSWLEEWAELSQSRRIGDLIDVMLGADRRSINMRQTSPFGGVLNRADRLEAIERARAK